LLFGGGSLGNGDKERKIYLVPAIVAHHKPAPEIKIDEHGETHLRLEKGRQEVQNLGLTDMG